jgi:hypothetical protein
MMAEETTRLSDLAPDGSMGVPGVPPTESTGGDAPPGGLPQQQQLVGVQLLSAPHSAGSLHHVYLSGRSASALRCSQQRAQRAQRGGKHQWVRLMLDAVQQRPVQGHHHLAEAG